VDPANLTLVQADPKAARSTLRATLSTPNQSIAQEDTIHSQSHGGATDFENADTKTLPSMGRASPHTSSRQVHHIIEAGHPKSSIPGHSKLFFSQDSEGSRRSGLIPAYVLQDIASRFSTETIIALQDRNRNLWLLDPAQNLSIGRSGHCDIVVKENSANVSRKHAYISGSDMPGVFYLTDTSAAGTLVNGIHCSKTSVQVRAGDLIHLGRSTDDLDSLTAFAFQDFSFSKSHRPIADLHVLERRIRNTAAVDGTRIDMFHLLLLYLYIDFHQYCFLVSTCQQDSNYATPNATNTNPS
jgi:hypothetical protein